MGFLGLNLAWSVDVGSVLVLMSVLALVITLGELLFNSRLVGRLGAALFFSDGSLRHLTNFLASGHPDSDQTWGFWKQIAFRLTSDICLWPSGFPPCINFLG